MVRLQVESRTPDRVIDILTSNLEIGREEVYPVRGVLDLGRLRQLMSARPPRPERQAVRPLRSAVLSPKSEEDLYSVIKREDILLHHPYRVVSAGGGILPAGRARSRRTRNQDDALSHRTEFARSSRRCWRPSENGKQVAVLVELKARFDEESNIEWARKLESEGVHVVYGLVGLKVHCKVALVVRREGNEIQRYVHLATGNYNAATARLYTESASSPAIRSAPTSLTSSII